MTAYASNIAAGRKRIIVGAVLVLGLVAVPFAERSVQLFKRLSLSQGAFNHALSARGKDDTECERLLEEAIRVRLSAVGDDIGTLRYKNILAALYVDQGRLAEAEPLRQETLRLGRKMMGENSEFTLACMDDLAALYNREGRKTDAADIQVMSERIKRTITGRPNVISGFHK